MTPSIPSDDPNPGLLVREIDGELVVLDPSAERVYQLNLTASLIWRMAREGSGVEAIAAAVAAEYVVEPEVAFRDVITMLSEFRALKLLVA